MSFKSKKITRTSPKNVATPKTAEEKLNYLRVKNKALDKLIDVFGCDVNL